MEAAIQKNLNPTPTRPSNGKDRVAIPETAFGCPRDFLNNRFVYAVISARAHGLSLGVNMTPDKSCSFDCLYCEVDRRNAPRETKLDVDAMAAELHKTLAFVLAGKLRERPFYSALPEELLTLRHVALSGDGEPTLAPNFAQAVESIVHIRALGEFPFFKIVLITNGTGLDQPQVQQGLKHFTKSDEIWAKLDGGTPDFFSRVDRSNVPLDKVLSNILLVARQRPVIIQSLFPAINGEEPPARGNRGIRPSPQGIEGGGRGHSPRANLLRHPADVSCRVRTSAAENPFPHRPHRPPRLRPQSRSVLTSRFVLVLEIANRQPRNVNRN